MPVQLHNADTRLKQAFDKLKELLSTAPVLGYPVVNGNLSLDTESSNFGIGAVLSQLQHVLAYGSRVHTDHSSLQWLIGMKEPEGQFAQWLERLEQYDFKVVHRPGCCHENLDPLFQRRCPLTCPCNLKEPTSSGLQIKHKDIQCHFLNKHENPAHGTVSPQLESYFLPKQLTLKFLPSEILME
ncbi:uncharacterized protein LOC106932848 [Tachysurus ichikawai]